MSKRTFKNGHAITTFPSNTGFCTALIGKYGETLKVIYSANIQNRYDLYNEWFYEVHK